ncbi:MAG: DUF3365 domain-containing protein [Calditrichaeota bacterium]|nr:DUF3365 domain-containing protein [Calditrichota bacterium]
MRLTTKVILIIVLTVTTIISIIFYVLMQRFEKQMEEDLLIRARSIYKNILIVRKWVSRYNGVYVLKLPGVKSNPYLPHPDLVTTSGDTLTLKNPALVTRELSELSGYMGGNFSFHMASLRYINPVNKPDEFETSALIYFERDTSRVKQGEFYRVERIDGHTIFRYVAPLYTEESCLTCHSAQGYKVGDLRGGISILVDMDRYQQAKQANLAFLFGSALFTILFLSILIFVAIQGSVIRPLRKIESAARKIQEGEYNFSLNLKQRDEIGNLARTFEVMRDRIQAYTRQLKDSEKKYRSLIEHSLEAVAIVDERGAIIDCNSKLLHLTGYDRETIRHLQLEDLLDLRQRRKIDPATPSNGDSERFETVLYTRDDLEIPVEIYLIRGFSLGDQSNLSFVYVRDLTERKKIEQYAIQTEKMFALGQLSSGIAHEIRNPLFALNNNIEYLKERFGDDPDFQEVYQELQNGVDRIQNIVSAILDYARPHQPEFKPVDIHTVIEKSLVLVQKQFEKSRIRIVTEFVEQPRKVQADPHQLEQVFINLFLNAFQAMDGAGQLKIVTRNQRHHLEIRIEDSGRGIPPEDLSRIFDPFYSKSPNGTGLGLAIVQRILDQHHARYRVESQLGLGTIFVISLPYKQRVGHAV